MRPDSWRAPTLKVTAQCGWGTRQELRQYWRLRGY
jgi:hypothetical protein